MRRERAVFAAFGACAALALGVMASAAPASAAANAKEVIYDATQSPLPGNLPSEAAEATGFSEFGDSVTFGGTARTLSTVTVTLSSWGCEHGTWNHNNCVTTSKAAFDEPITLNIYGAPSQQDDGTVTPGPLLTTATKSFAIPYRPSADSKYCNSQNNAVGKWYDKKTKTCYNGKATNVVFNFASLKLKLPDSAVIGVAYNTTHHGYNPIGESAPCYSSDGGCGYDSLNVGLNDDPATPSAGSQTYPGTVFETIDQSNAGEACDGTPVIGEFNLNSPTSPCWTGYVPAIKVQASGPVATS